MPIFAAEDWHVGVLAILAVLGPAAVWLLTYLANRRKTAIEEWQDVIRWQDQQIRALSLALEDCRERDGRHREAITYLHGLVTYRGVTMRQAGMAAEDVRALEDFLPDRDDPRLRQLAQNTALVRAEARKATPDPTTPPPQA